MRVIDLKAISLLGGLTLTVMEPCRVVIVDDEILIRQGIKHYFNWEEQGFLVVGEASNGQEALDLVESVKTHIIITDIVMPIMDGEELTKIVKERHPDIEMIILSSFGEFDYVRSTFQSGAVDYILKPKLEAEGLLKALHTAANRIPTLNLKENKAEVDVSVDQIIDKLISGFNTYYDQEAINHHFPHSHYYLLGVDKKDQSIQTVAYMKEEIERAFAKYFSHVVSHFVKSDKKTLIFLININKVDMVKIVPLITEMTETKADIRFVLSEVFTDLPEVAKVYNESLLKLIQCRFYLPERPVILHEKLLKAPSENVHFNLESFTEELKREHFEAAFSYLKDHVKILNDCYTMDIFEYKSFFNNIIFNVTILLRNMEYNVKVLEDKKYSYITSIDEASETKVVVDHLEQFIEVAKNCISTKQIDLGNPNMKKLMEYISDHYMEPLSLSKVANHFHFNPSYLSSYFATHNHEGFIEYLNKVRIEEATKLLRTGKFTISEISAIVGYSDHSYFCKVFKKIKGLSASKYRRKQYK